MAFQYCCVLYVCLDGSCTTDRGPIHPCEAEKGICLNNGSCLRGQNDMEYTCVCMESFIGERCEISRCNILNCKNNAVCVHGRCECLPGITIKTRCFYLRQINYNQYIMLLTDRYKCKVYGNFTLKHPMHIKSQ